ncbi:MAG TPA: SDR family oxidoreductase [Anaerolineales bacterium]|nr:SDR family oxidoreductase [Anaerolineales bacterium]
MTNSYSLVTGAGTRLGWEIAKSLLRRGHNLIAHYHQSTEGIKVLQAYGTELKRQVLPLSGDFSDYSGLSIFNQELVKLLNNNNGIIDLAVHSAAIMLSGGIEEVAYADLQRMEHINLIAPLMISQTLIPYLSDQSNLIMISDIAAERIWKKYPIYSMTKIQLEYTAKQFAKLLAPKTRANILALGLVMRAKDESENDWQQRIMKLPIQQTLSLDELSKAIEFILQSPSLTGAKITLDGGSLLV